MFSSSFCNVMPVFQAMFCAILNISNHFCNLEPAGMQ